MDHGKPCFLERRLAGLDYLLYGKNQSSESQSEIMVSLRFVPAYRYPSTVLPVRAGHGTDMVILRSANRPLTASACLSLGVASLVGAHCLDGPEEVFSHWS